MKAALFHNIGAIMEIDSILQADEVERMQKYHQANKKSISELETVKLGSDALAAIRDVTLYYFNETDFIEREDGKNNWMSNIILTADQYLQLETGLFGDKKKPSLIIDTLNVRAVNHQLNKDVVKALSQSLHIHAVVDFYTEIERLLSMCQFEGGGHAWPYPMTGFKSPAIFVCKNNKNICEHYQTSMKAVTLMRPMGELPEGKYSRCRLITSALVEYYKKHAMQLKSL